MRIMLEQSLIEKMDDGSFDENILENAGMSIIDAEVVVDEEAAESIMAESGFHETMDSMF